MSDPMTIPRVHEMTRDTAPGWFVAPLENAPAFVTGEPRPYAVCGGCRRYMGLHLHAIAADGTVSPSVVCPHEGCRWHVHLRLDGWGYGAKAAGEGVWAPPSGDRHAAWIERVFVALSADVAPVVAP